MERRTLSQEPAVRVINGRTYEVRVINGRESLVEKSVATPAESVASRPDYNVPVPLDLYIAKAAELELTQRAQKGAELAAAQLVQQAELFAERVQQADNELNLLALQTVQAQEEKLTRQQSHDQPNRSGDVWTPAHSAELNKQLQQDVAKEESIQSPTPVSGKPFDAFIKSIGQPKKRSLSDNELTEQVLDDAATTEKKKPSRKKILVVSGAVGTLATIIAVGVPMVMDANKQTEAQVAKPATGASPAEIEAIAKKQYPDITPASIALGQCLADGPGLFSGHASATSSEAWVFKAADGTLKGAQTPDKKYLPLEVQSAPFDVAACAPADARAAMVSMKDTTITIDKSKVTPEVRMAVGGTVTPTVQEFAAAPSVGLTDAGAKALNTAQADKGNMNSAATIAYANVARAITQKGSVDLGRVEAQMDTDLLQSVSNQITTFYKKQGKDAPAFNLTLTGEYLAPKVIDPATLPDILTKTKDIVRLTPATLTALDFNAAPAPTAIPTPAGK